MSTRCGGPPLNPWSVIDAGLLRWRNVLYLGARHAKFIVLSLARDLAAEVPLLWASDETPLREVARVGRCAESQFVETFSLTTVSANGEVRGVKARELVFEDVDDPRLAVAAEGLEKSQVKPGGPRGTRTHNPRIKSPLLCQLS